MIEIGVNSDCDSEASEGSTNSDNQNSPENEPNDYEKQRDLRVSQNKAKMEALGLHKIANSLNSLGRNKGKGKGKTTHLRRSKRVSKNSKVDDDDDEDEDEDDDDDGDDEFKPIHDDDGDSGLNGSSEELEDEGSGNKKKKKKKVGNGGDTIGRENVRNSGSKSKKVKNRMSRSDSRKSSQKSADIPDLMDEDEALKQAIALSLNEFGETPDQLHGGSNQHFREDNTRKKKSFQNRVQMSEDDLVIHFCQFDEVGKGSITLRDLQRMAASHDFTWTDKELADMICCFDSDRDGKLTQDDFRSIILRCNMLKVDELS